MNDCDNRDDSSIVPEDIKDIALRYINGIHIGLYDTFESMYRIHSEIAKLPREVKNHYSEYINHLRDVTLEYPLYRRRDRMGHKPSELEKSTFINALNLVHNPPSPPPLAKSSRVVENITKTMSGDDVFIVLIDNMIACVLEGSSSDINLNVVKVMKEIYQTCIEGCDDDDDPVSILRSKSYINLVQSLSLLNWVPPKDYSKPDSFGNFKSEPKKENLSRTLLEFRERVLSTGFSLTLSKEERGMLHTKMGLSSSTTNTTTTTKTTTTPKSKPSRWNGSNINQGEHWERKTTTRPFDSDSKQKLTIDVRLESNDLFIEQLDRMIEFIICGSSSDINGHVGDIIQMMQMISHDYSDEFIAIKRQAIYSNLVQCLVSCNWIPPKDANSFGNFGTEPNSEKLFKSLSELRERHVYIYK